MEVPENNLRRLLDVLIADVSNHVHPVSLGQYKHVCNNIEKFAINEGTDSYSTELLEGYLASIDVKLRNGTICHGYHRFQKRVVRMVSSLAQTGVTDFSYASGYPVKYPLDEECMRLVNAIFAENSISDSVKADLKAPMMHIFWYACKQGRKISSIDDELIMKFIVEEIPKSNSCSTDRTMRCVRYATAYLRGHGIAPVLHDYSMLKIKSPHIAIIPAYTEE